MSCGIVDAVGEQLADLVVVLGALGDRLLEDGGVAGHAGDVVLGDQALQLTAGQQLAADVVEPHRLALGGELLQRVRRRHQCASLASGASRGDDGVGVDARRGHQLGGRAGAGQPAHREVDDAARVRVVGERLEHGAGDAALGVVVLDDEQAPVCPRRGLAQGADVDRLDRVQVDDPAPHPLRGEAVGGGEAVVQGDPGADQRQRRPRRCCAAPCSGRSRTPRRCRRASGTRRAWCACTRSRRCWPCAAPAWRWRPGRSGRARWRCAPRASTARSSSAICDGPSAPISLPACEPASRMLAPEMPAMRTKS